MRVVITQKLSRWNRLAIAALLLFALVLPLLGGHANAYSLPSHRYIKMSSSANGSIADGQDVTYEMSFTTNQAGASSNIGGLVLEFCDNSPIIGDTCNAPTGFDAHAFVGDNTLALGTQTGTGGVDFAIDTTNAAANRIIFSRSPATTQIATNTQIIIPLGTSAAGDGITNPTTTNTTFYARVVSFTTQVGAEQYASTNIDNSGANTPVDAGGFALSTANQITITAKVPEKLTFCVYTSVATANTCSSPSGSAITLGDDHGVLSDQEEFVNATAKYTVATNALYDVAIRVKGGTLKTNPGCADTPGQSCSIDAMLPTGGPPGVTPVASAADTEQFGFCTWQSAGTGLTPVAPYNNASCNAVTSNAGSPGNSIAGDAANGAAFAFDNDIVNNPTNATISTYGQVFATKVAGTFSTGTLAFIGNIATTTEPGIYTTTLTFIATGTY